MLVSELLSMMLIHYKYELRKSSGAMCVAQFSLSGLFSNCTTLQK